MGISYNPEWWPESQWEKDFGMMKEMGFTTVRLGEFAWSSFEPHEGDYHFNWLDKVIVLAKEKGINIILGTPTAGIPPWLYKKDPNVLGANERGAFDYGGRKGFSIYNITMQQAAEKLINAMAEHYSKNPTVLGWQISNEPGYPFMNYDLNSLHAFRKWLKDHYGTIQRLNEAWGGTFWSNQYNDWDEIMFPLNSAEGGWRAGSRVDYRRFFSDSFLWWINFESDILKKYVKDQFIFTNWPDMRWSVNTYKTESLFQITAWDNYSAMPGTCDYHAQFYATKNHDLARCSRKDQLFFVSEQGTQAPTNSDQTAVRLQTYLGFAHGSQGTMFYEWRPPLAGNEQAYKSVLNVDGSYGPAEKEFRRMVKEFGRIGKQLVGATTDADIGMIYSYDNQWEQGFWQGKSLFEMTTTTSADGYDINFQRFYNGVKVLGRNVDIVAPEASKNKYKMMVVPGLQMVSEQVAKQLEDYVRQGGILVLDPMSGTRDMDARTRPLIPPGVFADIAGIKIRTTLLMSKTTGQYQMVLPDGTKATVSKMLEGVELSGAKKMVSFSGKGMEGKPAVTVNQIGKGFVVYVSAISYDKKFYDGLFAHLAKQFKIDPLLKVPEGVEVVSRKNSTGEFLFVMNLTDTEKTVYLPKAMTEIISNKQRFGTMIFPAFEVAIFKAD